MTPRDRRVGFSPAIAQISLSSVKTSIKRGWLLSWFVQRDSSVIQSILCFQKSQYFIKNKRSYLLCFLRLFQIFITGISKSIGNKQAFYNENGFGSSWRFYQSQLMTYIETQQYLEAKGSQSATGLRWRMELFSCVQNQNVRPNLNKAAKWGVS